MGADRMIQRLITTVVALFLLAAPVLAQQVPHPTNGPVSSSPSNFALFNDTTGTQLKATNVMTLDVNRSGEAGVSGNAPLKFLPPLSDSNTQGLFIQPTIGTFATNQYPSAVFEKWGDVGTPVPAGTHAYLYGYQCGIYTHQSAADTPSDNGGCVGSTIVLDNGAYYGAFTATATISLVPSNYKGVNINVTNNVAPSGTTIYGVYAGSTGSQNGTAAFKVGPATANKWTYGLDLSGTQAIGASTVGFAVPSTAVPTDYIIDGSNTDTFRMTGGGSVKGINFYVHPTVDGGAYRFCANRATGACPATIDYTGLGQFSGLSLKPITVASLPGCGAPSEGYSYPVTDATSAIFNTTFSGAGTNHIMAYCNGTVWVVH